jgi:hypothetical protein
MTYLKRLPDNFRAIGHEANFDTFALSFSLREMQEDDAKMIPLKTISVYGLVAID